MSDQPERTPDEYLAAFRADPLNAPLALYAGASLDAAGRHEEALVVWTLGDDANAALRTIRLYKEADPAMRAHSTRADEAIRAHFNKMHRDAIEAVAQETGDNNLDRIRNGIWTHYHDGPTPYRTPHQCPVIFYVPDLPAAPVVSNDALAWADTLEAAFPDILAEYEAAIADGAGMEPYVPPETQGAEWSKLRGTLDWSAVYLYFNAEKTPNTERFPKTVAAMQNADLLRKRDLPMEAFFSRLTPGAHIPPHYGLTNTRLTVHLPIIAPEGCSIRVGETIHRWRAGELVAFDDSYQHEAWNKSAEDRVVLIFETHHPSLTANERLAIERIYETFDAWVAGRRAKIGLA